MHCGSKVRYFIENLTYFFIAKSGRKYFHKNSYNFSMTLISQDEDDLSKSSYADYNIMKIFALVC